MILVSLSPYITGNDHVYFLWLDLALLPTSFMVEKYSLCLCTPPYVSIHLSYV